MFAKLADDLAELPALLDHTRAVAIRVLDSLDDRPVAAAIHARPAMALPESGDGEHGHRVGCRGHRTRDHHVAW
ncbi:hypothetical protein [Kibdelosporangium aridum]|uniref:hypothetical protein n=1 Tax=Kibdelosporangium aridum TaxID=2030 RepID=UPI00068C6237